jgi:hypothetical protein
VTLGQIGKPAVSSLKEALKGREASVSRCAALYALSRMGPEAREAAPALRELSKAGKWIVSPLAAYALARVSPEDRKVAVARLCGLPERLKDEEPGAALLLGWLHPEGSKETVEWPGVRALGKSLDSRRFTADLDASFGAYVLAQLGPQARPAREALRGALEHKDSVVRLLAAYALARSSPADRKSAVATLTALYRDEVKKPTLVPSWFSRFAEWAGEVAPDDREAAQAASFALLESLCDALRAQDPGNRFPNSYALWWLSHASRTSDCWEEWNRRTPLVLGLVGEALRQIDPDAARKLGIRAAGQ